MRALTLYVLCKLILSITVSVVGIATPAGAMNILVNSGFESGNLAPWFQDQDFSGTEDWNVTSADAHSGAFSATDVGDKSIRQNFSAVPTDDIVEISLWIKQPSPTCCSALRFFYSDGSVGGASIFLSTPEWEFFDVTDRLDPDKELSGFGIFGFLTVGTPRTFVDDVSVNIPEPTAGLLLTSGLIGLAINERRRRA